jgi:hypothetical protein
MLVARCRVGGIFDTQDIAALLMLQGVIAEVLHYLRARGLLEDADGPSSVLVATLAPPAGAREGGVWRRNRRDDAGARGAGGSDRPAGAGRSTPRSRRRRRGVTGDAPNKITAPGSGGGWHPDPRPPAATR